MKGKNFCLNCENEYQGNEDYCTHCGQHRLSHDLAMSKVLRELFQNFFNIDSRFYQTVKNIWRPYFLTRKYISGHRKSYLLPSQSLLFSLFLLFTLVLLYLPSLNDMTKKGPLSKAELATHRVKFDTLAEQLIVDTTLRKELRARLYEEVDSLDNFIPTVFNLSEKYAISVSDVYNKSVDSIIAEKKIDKWYEKIILRQSIKYLYNPVGSTKYLIGNMSWVFLLTVILSAFFAKLVYIRGGYFLIEHLTFNMFLHTLMFLLVSLAIILDGIIENEDTQETINVSIAILTLSLVWWNIYKYYQDSVIKTLAKMFLMFMFYTMVLTFCALAVLAISLLFI